MASASPLVSFGLPTPNRYKLSQRSLAPVATQAHGDFECIIIDNCSDDNTPDG
jgi:glycosyltransferase involved in cell wall biosynthesis